MVLNIKKRVVIRLGDIFIVKLDDCQKYFQYVADDMAMLNSRVIRVFEKKYPLESMPDLTEIAQGDIDFYAHTSVKLGIKMGLWGKLGNSPVLGEIDVIFCRSRDYTEGLKVKISERWEIWYVNEEFRYVGKLKGENRNAELGLVEPPNEIVERMRTGKYSYSYPGFE
jgi:hypothetical protein